MFSLTGKHSKIMSLKSSSHGIFISNNKIYWKMFWKYKELNLIAVDTFQLNYGKTGLTNQIKNLTKYQHLRLKCKN